MLHIGIPLPPRQHVSQSKLNGAKPIGRGSLVAKEETEKSTEEAKVKCSRFPLPRSGRLQMGKRIYKRAVESKTRTIF